jgi:hypothetical protein
MFPLSRFVQENSMFHGIVEYSTYRKWQPDLARSSVAILMLATLGCGSAPPDPKANRMVYYDRETRKAVVSNISQEMPAIHPQTGKPTLVPSSYCPQCQQWFPSPPIEVRQRNPEAAICPKGHALTQNGPWPEETLSEMR